MPGRNLFAGKGRNLIKTPIQRARERHPEVIKPEIIGGPETLGEVAQIEPKFESAEEAAKATTRAVMPYARPVIETGSSITAALTATPTTLIGMAAAGGLGYGIGAKASDIIEQWAEAPSRKQPETLKGQLAQSAKDIAFGTTMEMGGQLAIKGITTSAKFAMNKLKDIGKALPPLTKAGATQKAGQVITAQTADGPLIAQNMAEAEALEEAIPGLKFSRGQATGDPGVIKFERARARMPGDVAQEQLEQAASNTKAIIAFMDEQKGVSGISDVIDPLAQQQQALETGVTAAGKALEREGAQMAGMGPVETGEAIRTAAQAGKKEAQKQAGKLFEEVPEFPINAKQLISKIDELSAPTNKFEAVGKNVPEEFAQYKKILEESGGISTPQDLQGLRSNLAESLRDAQGAASPNNRVISRLSQLIGEVDTVLKEAGEIKPPTGVKTKPVADAAEKLKTAQQFWKKEVIDKFKTGTTGDILKKGASGDKVSNAQIASRYFKPGRAGVEQATEFVDSVGDNPQAREAIEDYIKQDLLSASTNPVTGEVIESKLKTWLTRHKPALKKLGLENRFNTIVKASEELNKAKDMKIAFDKSVASKMLNSDIDTAVKNAFATGSKSKAASRLMGQLKGDKKAISGLQNATIDHVITNAETTAADAFNNPVLSLAKVEGEFKKLKPALKVLFKDSPEKLEALNKFRSALKILQRGKTSPLGGGSDTAENVITAMSKASGLSHSRALNIIKALAKPLRDMSDNQVNAILNRAAFDPEFAQTIQMAAKGRPIKIIESRFKNHLAALGLREALKDKEQ